jgi:hypothetical protein
MQPIKLLDATDSGMGAQGTSHVELCYAAIDAAPSHLTRTVPKLGTVKAQICPSCLRIILHG